MPHSRGPLQVALTGQQDGVVLDDRPQDQIVSVNAPQISEALVRLPVLWRAIRPLVPNSDSLASSALPLGCRTRPGPLRLSGPSRFPW